MNDLYELGLKGRPIGVLKKRGITCQRELALLLPKTYKDYRKLKLVKEATPTKEAAFSGVLTYCEKRYGKRSYMVLRMTQEEGTAVGIQMFTETMRFAAIKKMVFQKIVVYGVPYYDMNYGWQIKGAHNVDYIDTYRPRIEAVYPQVAGITEDKLVKAIRTAASKQTEPLEKELLSRYRLLDYRSALRKIHLPASGKDILDGKHRIVFNDMLYFNLMMERSNRDAAAWTNISMPQHEMQDELIQILPYSLTSDQQMVLNEFNQAVSAMTQEGVKRFNSLVQGDVGCGKTVVAIAMMVRAVENGYQAVLMTPREILAEQHFHEVESYAKKLNIQCAFLHSSMKAKEKKAVIQGIKKGTIQIIVGTHSCVADAIEYHKLGLTVVDEEHLFGVSQKEGINAKAKAGIHSVSMSATPIPRSLAQIVYGNGKTILSIKTKPPGRLPVKTATQKGHSNVFAFMLQEIKAGHQCYVVCPAIESNEDYDIVSLEEMEKLYRAQLEPLGVRIGVVNGKMTKEEASNVVGSFASGHLDILMSTTVIEVGVNVPNATVITIEQADRFGLASLHQLRGRVGRSSMQSYCILVSSNGMANPRIQTMCRTNDGFEIAQADFEQRGSGDLFGERQAGYNRFVDEMLSYQDIFNQTKDVAKYCISHHLGQALGKWYTGECE